jgi:hypothetical protein
MDAIEKQYEQAIRMARDDDEAYELSIGLKEYRLYYKATA